MTLARHHREVAILRKTGCRRSVAILLALILQTYCSIAKAQTEETKPVFELDCINFEGRFLGKAPVKKKAYLSLAADGTAWSITPDNKVSITRIFEGEAAAKAGLEPGDEIISVNGYPTEGAKLGELICFYHTYEPSTLTETLVVKKKKDGTQQTLQLTLLPMDKCNAEEKHAWLDIYKGLGY